MDGEDEYFMGATPAVPEQGDATDATWMTGDGRTDAGKPDEKVSKAERLDELMRSQLAAPYASAPDRPAIMRLREGRDPELICGRIAIVGNVPATDRSAQGLRVACQTISGDIVSVEILRTDLHSARPEFVGRLCAMGFAIYSGIVVFLAFMRSLEVRNSVPSAMSPGWATSMNSYCLPSGEIVAGADMAEEWLPIVRTSKADVEEWWNKVGYLMRGNPVLMFSVLAVLAGCLLRVLGKDGLFFHWSGPSSSGKTRVLMLASTVFPGMQVSSWKDTPQAMTDKARDATDSALLIDDAPPDAARKIASVIMTLGTGIRPTTRGELKSGATSPKDRSFRVSVQSTGETMISSLLSQAGIQRDGHTARVIDIPVDRATIAQNLHDAASSYDLMKQIEDAIPTVPRTLGPALAQIVLNASEGNLGDWRQICQNMGHGLSKEVFSGSRQVDGIYLRNLEQFAVVKFTGHFVASSGLLPITEEEVTNCVLEMANIWFAEAVETAVPEAQRACNLLKQWLLKNDHKLIEIVGSGRLGKRGSRHLGFLDDDAYYLTADALAKASAGQIEPRRMATYLDQAGWLEGKQSAKSLQYKLYVTTSFQANVYKIPRHHVDTE